MLCAALFLFTFSSFFGFSVYKRFRDIRSHDPNFSKHDKLSKEDIFKLPEFAVRQLLFFLILHHWFLIWYFIKHFFFHIHMIMLTVFSVLLNIYPSIECQRQPVILFNRQFWCFIFVASPSLVLQKVNIINGMYRGILKLKKTFKENFSYYYILLYMH